MCNKLQNTIFITYITIAENLGGTKEHIQFFDSGWSVLLVASWKIFRSNKRNVIFSCETTPAFKLQNAISGCISTNVFLLVPVIYNVSKIYMYIMYPRFSSNLKNY